MKKEWKALQHEWCPNCGDSLEVLSEYPESGDTETMQWLSDCDEVRCVSCGFKSAVSVDEEDFFVQDGNIYDL